MTSTFAQKDPWILCNKLKNAPGGISSSNPSSSSCLAFQSIYLLFLLSPASIHRDKQQSLQDGKSIQMPKTIRWRRLVISLISCLADYLLLEPLNQMQAATYITQTSGRGILFHFSNVLL